MVAHIRKVKSLSAAFLRASSDPGDDGENERVKNCCSIPAPVIVLFVLK
jgi:hypothetical protein